MPNEPSPRWWRDFFESSDSLELSFFPDERETGREARGLEKLLGLSGADRILDLCCGYGRHMEKLARRAFCITGLDASALMLRCARAVLHEAGVTAPLVRGDAAHLPFADNSFDVVMLLFNSFGYFAEDGQNERVLRETARVLRPGGRLFLDTRNREFQILYAPYHQRICVSDGRELVLRCRYDRARKRLNSRWSLPDNPDAVVHEASIRLYGLDELRIMLAAADFEELGVYGAYNGEPFEGWQRQLLWVGRAG